MSSFLDVPDSKDSIVKITAFCYRKPDVSWDYFIQYWRNTHVFKFTKNPEVEKLLLGYVQCHRDEAATKEMGPVPLEDFDGYAEFYVKTIEDWHVIASQHQHLTETMPDMDFFCDSARMKLLVTNYEPRFWKIPSLPTPPSQQGREVRWNHPTE